MKCSNWNYKFENGKYFIIPNKPIPPPASLSKYYSLSEHNLEAFKKNYFYFAHPLKLNDPYDSWRIFLNLEKFKLDQYVDFFLNKKLFILETEASDEVLTNRIRITYLNEPKRLQNIALVALWNLIFKDWGVLSMTNNNESMLMWAYYTNHDGYLLQFKNKALCKSIIGPFYELFRRL